MDDATFVRVRERVRQLPSVVHDMLGCQWTGVEHGAEGPTLDEFHGDIRLAVGFADFVHGADVRMIERCGRACLTNQPRARGGIVEAGCRQDLDRDVSIELFIAGAIHLAHATSTQSADDAVVREPPAIHTYLYFNTNRCARRLVTISAV